MFKKFIERILKKFCKQQKRSFVHERAQRRKEQFNVQDTHRHTKITRNSRWKHFLSIDDEAFVLIPKPNSSRTDCMIICNGAIQETYEVGTKYVKKQRKSK